MTIKELRQYNGKDGNKAYVAYKGKVYDVTHSTSWDNGVHQGMHEAGLDLTHAMENAPHAEEVFDGFTVVDTLEDDEEEDEHKIDAASWYRKYHPHPMLVHFPIALHLFAVVLNMLFLFSKESSFATAVFYSLSAATLMGVFAMLSGILSWSINYQLVFSPVFIIKLSLSIVTLLLGLTAVVLYLNDPDVVYLSSPASLLYHGSIFLSGMSVIIVAYHGGKLTWPEKESS